MIADNRPLLVITARAGSSRLPGKVLKPIYKSFSILEFLIQRLSRCQETSRLVITTGYGRENDKIEEIGRRSGIGVLRGPEEDVLKRVDICLNSEQNVDIIGRVTADNPLTDPSLIKMQLREMRKSQSDYSYCLESPVGTAVDLWTKECFKKMYSSAKTKSEREHINSWVWNNPEKNKILWFKPSDDMCNKQKSVTIDTAEDYTKVKRLIENNKDPLGITLSQIINFNYVGGK